jgi:hypothetical protein
MNRAAERGNEFWLKKTLEVELEEKRQKANKVCFYIEVLLCDVGGCGKKGKINKCKGEVEVCVVTAHRCNAVWWLCCVCVCLAASVGSGWWEVSCTRYVLILIPIFSVKKIKLHLLKK